MFVDFNILNQLGSPSINSNTFANRPAAGQTGRLFVSTDTFEIYRDNGTGWDLIGGPGAGTITGTGTATQVAYFTGAQTLGSSSNLFWDNTNTRLGIGTSTPGVRLDVHGTGNMLHLNATGATANTLMAFQRLGSNVWRLGDQYSGGLNYFELHNAVLINNAAEFQAATNKATFSALQTYSSGGATGSLFSYTLTVPNGTNFTSPNVIGNVNSALTLNLGGNTTVPVGARQGLEGNSRISFTGAGTLTMTQGSTVRAFSALSSVYSFAGSAVGTVTHLAGLRICFPDNIGSAVNVTNNYGILINSQTTGTGTVTYTNRWGIYQEGSADVNHFAGAILQGTTTNTGFGIYTNSSFRSDTLSYLAASSGGVVIGSTNALSSSALLQLDSTTAGLLIPRLTTTQRNAIVSAAAGLVIYNTTTAALEFYNGTSWTSGGGGITGSGAAGQVTYWTGASTVAGTNNFFWDNTNVRLGIGTNTPAVNLEISGTGNVAARLISSNNFPLFQLRDNRTTGFEWNIENGRIASGTLTFYYATGTAARMNINANGNVGVNVTPAAWSATFNALQLGARTALINSDINFTGLNNNTYYDGSFYRYLTTAAASSIELGNGFITFANAPSGTAGTVVTGTERMRIDTSGNIGLGTSTIGSRLQVNGGAAIGYSASTAAPTNGLAVSGDILGAGNVRSSNGTINNALTWQTGPDVGIVGTLSNHSLSIWTNSTQRLIVSNTSLTFSDAIDIVFNATTGTKIATATTQKLAFWNKTPIVQPTTAVASATRVGGAGTNITTLDTFGGYTLAQVVQALQNVGILA